MYQVIGTTRSRAFRVMWMLDEIGQDYTQVPAGPGTEEARQYNPLGKIPALVDGTDVLTDSVAIMTYLGDKHGQLTATAGTPARARQDAITLWLIDEFDALLWTASKHSFVLPKELRVPAIKDSLGKEFERSAKLLSHRLEGPFLMGDHMTHADILACHCLSWGVMMGFPKSDDKLSTWAKGLRQRPAYKAAGANAP